MLDHPQTPLTTLRRARQLALQQGLSFVYTGNLPDPEGNTTYCNHCGEAVIRRQGYILTSWQLNADGRCIHCGGKVPGQYESSPGNWGARRLPVRIHD